MLRLFAARAPLAVVMTFSVISIPAVVQADTGCPIQVEPAAPETKWHEEARAAATIFSKGTENQHDCRSIRIEVQPEGNALLTFTTMDGRIAVRLLHAADDIAPSIEALLVTSLVDKPLEIPQQTSNSTPEKKQSAPEKGASRTNSPPKLVPEVAAGAPRMLFRGMAGVRFGIDGGAFAPAIGLHAAMRFSPWELGFGGEWNPLYLPLTGSAPSGYSMRSFQANFLFGRHFGGQRFGFRAGPSLGIALVHQEMDSDPATKDRIDIDAVQPRVGGYGGITIPRQGAFRLYLGLQADMALWGMRANGTLRRNLPGLSRFGAGLSLGLEFAP